jgi:hypothetical protein
VLVQNLALTNKGELRMKRELWSDLRMGAEVVGPMLECALWILLGAREEGRVWPSTILDIDRR